MEIRKFQYPILNGGLMVLRAGQRLCHGNIEFQISHFKEIPDPGNNTVVIFIRRDGDMASYPWKKVINGSSVIEYDIKFLRDMQ